MKKEVENYIKKKMARALLRWKHAQKKYEECIMRDAANLYAEAMILYYSCAQDLIDGVGFIDEKGEAK